MKVPGPRLMNKHLFNAKIKTLKNFQCVWFEAFVVDFGNVFPNGKILLLNFCYQKHICIRDLTFTKHEDHHGRCSQKVLP